MDKDLRCAAERDEFANRRVIPKFELTDEMKVGFDGCYQTTAVDNFFMADRKALGMVLWDGMHS